MGFIKGLIVLVLGAISAIYLVNPGAGFIELIPDVTPFVGNLDEATATLLLINCLAYFGIDVRNLFGKKSNEKVRETSHLESKP